MSSILQWFANSATLRKITELAGLPRWLGGVWPGVNGPASAVDNRIAVFDATTGKLIKDGGNTIAELGPILAGTGLTKTGNTLQSYLLPRKRGVEPQGICSAIPCKECKSRILQVAVVF